VKDLIVTSSEFKNRAFIPIKFTCDGSNVNPPLEINKIPENTESLVLIVDDPDAPNGMWVHWVVWNISPVLKIGENQVPGIEGVNDFRKHSYGGPCPPSGTHRYFFKIYALDTRLDLDIKSRKSDLERAMKEHVLAKGKIIGLYNRTKKF
jgi:Raf kinase inhibitor-like YbhB/YbcL family protein